MSVEINIDKWIKTLNAAEPLVMNVAEKDLYAVATKLYSKTIEYTPVGDPSLWSYEAPKGYKPGTLKKSWEINYQPTEVTIKNEQPYALRVEYGWSTQAPNGMLRRALLSFPQFLEEVARDNKL